MSWYIRRQSYFIFVNQACENPAGTAVTSFQVAGPFQSALPIAMAWLPQIHTPPVINFCMSYYE